MCGKYVEVCRHNRTERRICRQVLEGLLPQVIRQGPSNVSFIDFEDTGHDQQPAGEARARI